MIHVSAMASPDTPHPASGYLLSTGEEKTGLASTRSVFIRLPPATTAMRVGLLGGSFDPAHAGHRHISLEAMARLDLDRVWWLVSPGNPLKNHDGLAGLRQRIARARAIANHPRITVTGFEADLGTAYTAETLQFLAQRRPGARFVWLMGADNLASFNRWRHWRMIMQLMPVAVLDRPGWRHRALASEAAHAFAAARLPESDARGLAGCAPPAWCYLSIPLSGLSSTVLRRAAPARLLPSGLTATPTRT